MRVVRPWREYLPRHYQRERERLPEVSTRKGSSATDEKPLKIRAQPLERRVVFNKVELPPAPQREYYWIVMSMRRKYLILFCKLKCQGILTRSENLRSRNRAGLQYEHVVWRWLPLGGISLRPNWSGDFNLHSWHC